MVVAATANQHKLDEMRGIFGDAVELLPRPVDLPEVVEDADTFEGNARLKAVAVAEHTGHVALADDSGLEVDALDGEPGVQSAYYGGGDHDGGSCSGGGGSGGGGGARRRRYAKKFTSSLRVFSTGWQHSVNLRHARAWVRC